jgi:hypothetical protein
VLLGAGAGAGVSPAERFTRSLSIPTGRRPESLVAGDLNDDGDIDLAVTHAGSNEVAILLGQGDGSLAAPLTLPVGDRPVIPALADFDGDGRLDLAVPNLFSDDVSLLMGDGEGGFRSMDTLPVDGGPIAVAPADFDGDGDIDLAVVNSAADNVTLYFNRRADLTGGAVVNEPRSLGQNIPNPFNPATTITYSLLHPSLVNLVVFNTSGKIVSTLVDELRPAGQHSTFWDGTNKHGDKMPSGIYFYRLTTDDAVELRRMTLVR